ncbi:MAG: hypothetical protein Q8R28_16970 [Dehalococcoidia bacterium]|nr:hypothetical protein [Dehalococcoidia bacterium]
MTPAEFTRQLNELRSIIGDGMAMFSAWQELMVGDQEAARALNRYRGLFLSARVALQRAAILQFAKVFDHDPRTVSLPNLIGAAKLDLPRLMPNGTVQDLEEIERKLEANKPVLNGLQTVRNQRIAHHDIVPSKKAKLLFGDMKRLVAEVELMYNLLRHAHDQRNTSFRYMAADAKNHTKAVIAIMQEEMERISSASLLLATRS